MAVRISGFRGVRNFKVNTKKAAEVSEAVYRRALTELFSNIVVSTPVDTGRLRGNWQADNAPSSTETGRRDTGGRQTISAAKAFISRLKSDTKFAFFNNVPYALKIEQGSSRQAPQGMVAINVANFERFVKKAILRERGTR